MTGLVELPVAPAQAGAHPNATYGAGRGWIPAFAGMTVKALILLARLWQVGPSRLISPTCRYSPSCSAYAIAAWRLHGVIRGSYLAARRILRCHPWGGCGHDPVPPCKDQPPRV